MCVGLFCMEKLFHLSTEVCVNKMDLIGVFAELVYVCVSVQYVLSLFTVFSGATQFQKHIFIQRCDFLH